MTAEPGVRLDVRTVVPVEGREHLVDLDLHGRSLLEHARAAVWAARLPERLDPAREEPVVSAGLLLVPSRPQRSVVPGVALDPGAALPEGSSDDVVDRWLLVHDPCCPGTPSGFITDVLTRAVEERRAGRRRAVVGVRAVSDTVKAVSRSDVDSPAVVGDTVDRTRLVNLASPVVVPDGWGFVLPPSLTPSGLAAAVAAWVEQDLAVLVEAPPQAARVESEDGVAVLAAALPRGRRAGGAEPSGAPRGAPSVEVVPVDESRWREYREVRLRALREDPFAFGSTYAENLQRDDESWRARAREADIWLAIVDGVPVGTVSSAPDGERPATAWLLGMWVAPEARGRGVGRALVASMLGHAAASGVDAVMLHVAETNVDAVRLYAAAGFVATGRSGTLDHDPGIVEVELVWRRQG